MRTQRGYTLIQTLIAITIGYVLGQVVLELLSPTVRLDRAEWACDREEPITRWVYTRQPDGSWRPTVETDRICTEYRRLTR